MAHVADKLWTLEEFLAFDDGTDTSYELFEGRIVAMNPPLRGHAALVGRLVRIIGNRLKPPFEVYAEAGIIPVNRRHSWYNADLIVTCTPGNHKDQFIAEPVLVVEVLSPTTSATDFSRKLPDHELMPSMRHPAGVEHGAPDPPLATRSGSLDGAPASRNGHPPADRAAGRPAPGRAVRRHSARMRAQASASGRHRWPRAKRR